MSSDNMEIFENVEFEGHFPLDAKLSEKPGIYIICTRTSGMGGIKILGAYEADNISESLKNNPKKECWQKHKETDLTVCFVEMEKGNERKNLLFRLVNRRWYPLDCVDPITDDF